MGDEKQNLRKKKEIKKRKDKLHQNYLKRKASGKQKEEIKTNISKGENRRNTENKDWKKMGDTVKVMQNNILNLS